MGCPLHTYAKARGKKKVGSTGLLEHQQATHFGRACDVLEGEIVIEGWFEVT